jgi:hypothetical protein
MGGMVWIGERGNQRLIYDVVERWKNFQTVYNSAQLLA